MQKISSTPPLDSFDPNIIPFQYNVIKDIRHNYDYSLGLHEVLLSGAVGSSKTVLATHIIVTHCLLYPGAIVGIGRLSLPHLKATLYKTILEHIDGLVDYAPNDTQAIIKFANGSVIRSVSWSDKKYMKVRSYEFSMFVIEELVETETREMYDEIFERIRLPHVPEKILMSLTNPGDPAHWAYKHFFMDKDPNKHVYLSKTEDNPFLEESYILNLKKNLDPKMARRKLYGEWLSISQDVVYYAYDSKDHFFDADYLPNLGYPIYWSFDFNIGEGKPMSSIFFQFINDKFHFFNEIVVEGVRTADVMDEAKSRNLLNYKTTYIITGDACGAHRDTRSKVSDYEIITTYFAKYLPNVRYQRAAPLSNPPIRRRHNIMNAYFKNEVGEKRIKLYKPCKTADEGCRLTKLKSGGKYIEDDSKKYQHITTAMGYGILTAISNNNKKGVMLFDR